MGRMFLPRLIALIAIGSVVVAIYYMSDLSSPSRPQEGVVYVNPSIGAAPAPAPAP